MLLRSLTASRHSFQTLFTKLYYTSNLTFARLKMPYLKIYSSTVIPAPIEDVWVTIRNFGDMSWHPTFDESSASAMRKGDDPAKVGSIRELTTLGGAKFVETLLELSDNSHTLVYLIPEMPFPAKNLVGTMRLTKITDGNQTFFEWFAEAEAANQEDTDVVTNAVLSAVYDPGFKALKDKFSSA
jgi:hypothetical protein